MLPLLFLLLVGIVAVAVYLYRRKTTVAACLKAIDDAVDVKLNAAQVDLADVSTAIFTAYRDMESRGEIEPGATVEYVERRVADLKAKVAHLVAKA
jgi:hypothetical protein